jgi:hypothetical protein
VTRSHRILFPGLAFLSLILAGGATAQNEQCLICHQKPGFKKILESGRVISLYIDPADLETSSHAGRLCTDCHADITEIPHRGVIQKVNCSRCHYEGNVAGAPQLNVNDQYLDSVHGKQLQDGNERAPVCQDCHGTHDIRSHLDPEAAVYRLNIPDICARCHLSVYNQFQVSVHGRVVREGNPDAPVCTDCHGEHDIQSTHDPENPNNEADIGGSCPKCHASVGLMNKYGIPTTQVDTYRDSFHGIAMQYGSRTVANCASCHGVHNILPSGDPESTIHIDNIPATCGKCHPGANINFARGKIHIEPSDPEAGVVYYVSMFFKWLTITVMIGLLIHIALDLYRKVRSAKNE